MSLAASISEHRLGRHPARGAGTEPDDRDATAHGRRPRPGTRIEREIGRRLVAFLDERHDRLARHGRALDIDRALRHAGLHQRRLRAREVAADLHDDRGVGEREAADELFERQRCGQNDQRIVAQGHRRRRRAPGAADRGDAGHDRHRKPLAQADEEMHERAVEERIAFARKARRRGRLSDAPRSPPRLPHRNGPAPRDRADRRNATRWSSGRRAEARHATASASNRRCRARCRVGRPWRRTTPRAPRR